MNLKNTLLLCRLPKSGGQSITTLHHRWLLVLSRNLVTFPRNSEMDPNIPIVVLRKEIMNGFCGPPSGFSNTLPETNIFAPQNGWLENYSPFGMAYF